MDESRGSQSVAYNDPSTSSSESSDAALDDESLDSSEDENSYLEYNPLQCIFCGECSEVLSNTISHMKTAHSFQLPYQDHLSVDTETILWYLHLVIHHYCECLFCGKKRTSPEATQQHMKAKGHCRIDLTGEYGDFYDLPASQIERASDFVQPDKGSVRLSSGKILGNKSQNKLSSKPRQMQRKALPEAIGESSSEEKTNAMPSEKNSLEKRDAKMDGLALQLAAMRASDRNSLMHLTPSEQRSALVTRKKQIDKARRDQRRAQANLERMGNSTLQKHFKADTPGRKNG